MIDRYEYWSAQCDGCNKQFTNNAATQAGLMETMRYRNWFVEASGERAVCPDCQKVANKVRSFLPEPEETAAAADPARQ